jgi:hypothetical protein
MKAQHTTGMHGTTGKQFLSCSCWICIRPECADSANRGPDSKVDFVCCSNACLAILLQCGDGTVEQYC